jgi:hypothetical protein
MAQLDSQERRLNSVEAAVESLSLVHVLPRLPVFPQLAHDSKAFVVCSEDGSTLTKRAEVLARIETEACEASEPPNTLALVASAVRLRRVLYNPQPVVPRGGADGIEIRRLPIKVNRHNSDRARADRRCQGRWVESHRALIDINESHHASRLCDGRSGCDERMSDGDHLVTRADAHREISEPERIRTAVDPCAERHFAKCCELLLEGFYFLTTDELRTPQGSSKGVD